MYSNPYFLNAECSFDIFFIVNFIAESNAEGFFAVRFAAEVWVRFEIMAVGSFVNAYLREWVQYSNSQKRDMAHFGLTVGIVTAWEFHLMTSCRIVLLLVLYTHNSVYFLKKNMKLVENGYLRRSVLVWCSKMVSPLLVSSKTYPNILLCWLLNSLVVSMPVEVVPSSADFSQIAVVEGKFEVWSMLVAWHFIVRAVDYIFHSCLVSIL